MTWNYRVVENKIHTDKGNTHSYIQIAEVYYDKNGKITGWGDLDYNLLTSEDLDGIKETLELMSKACNKPIIKITDGERLYEK